MNPKHHADRIQYCKISPQGRFLFSCAEQNTERNPSQPEPVPKTQEWEPEGAGSAHTKALIHKKDNKWPNTEPYVEPFEGIATKT